MKEEIKYSGVEDIGLKLKESSQNISEILKDSKEVMNSVINNKLFEGDLAKRLQEKFQLLSSEFESFSKEINNYSEFMYKTVISYIETDDKIKEITNEINTLDDARVIGE